MFLPTWTAFRCRLSKIALGLGERSNRRGLLPPCLGCVSINRNWLATVSQCHSRVTTTDSGQDIQPSPETGQSTTHTAQQFSQNNTPAVSRNIQVSASRVVGTS